MRTTSYIIILTTALVIAAMLSGASLFREPSAAPTEKMVAVGSADVVLTASGCTAASSFVLPATHAPTLLVRNDAAEAMVFTVPQLQRSVSLAPGQSKQLELPRYIMGAFASYCLTDQNHTKLGGNNSYLCILQPDEIAPYALTVGTFTIAPHERIKELAKPPA